MSVQSLRMRSTHGSSSNMMEWLIPLKNSLTNFPMTSTTEAYSPMMLHKRSIINQSLINTWFVTDSTVLLPVSLQLLAILEMTSAQGLKISGTEPSLRPFFFLFCFVKKKKKNGIIKKKKNSAPDFRHCDGSLQTLSAVFSIYSICKHYQVIITHIQPGSPDLEDWLYHWTQKAEAPPPSCHSAKPHP